LDSLLGYTRGCAGRLLEETTLRPLLFLNVKMTIGPVAQVEQNGFLHGCVPDFAPGGGSTLHRGERSA